MALDTLLAELTKRASGAPALGKSLKFDFGDNKILIDGTGASNVISTDDKEADCVISITQDDMLGLMNGSLNPMTAFMSGKIKVKGDMGIAMKLQTLLK